MIELERNALVWGVVGNLGGGKSLSAVNLAVRSMLNGYFVCSNITINTDEIARSFDCPWVKKLYLHISLDDPSFDPFKLPCGSPRGSSGGKRVIIVLDEVAEWFDQYTNASRDPRIQRVWSWLRHSSKRSQDVVIVCQRQEYINKVVRTLIARWIWVDDLAVYRIPKLKCKLPFCSGLVMQNVFDRMGQKIGSASFIRKSKWGRFYDTAECLNATGSHYNDIYDVPKVRYSLNELTLILYFASLLILIFKVK